MDKAALERILREVASGKLDVLSALDQLKFLPFKDLGFAKVDHHREIRKDFPEVIYCPNKTPGNIIAIISELMSAGSNVLATKLAPKVYGEIKDDIANGKYNKLAQTLSVVIKEPGRKTHKVALVTAGTSDIPVAEEAYETLDIMGNDVLKVYDAGVAGVHRLIGNVKLIENTKVIIVVAGMEGALASIVGGIFDKPVIGVPTSVGYGANFGGVSALLGMLTSCASNVCVVNIDNGFGAACIANLINSD